MSYRALDVRVRGAAPYLTLCVTVSITLEYIFGDLTLSVIEDMLVSIMGT